MTWTHPCRLVWDLAERPDPADPVSGEGRCAHCGLAGQLHGRLGANFTDQRALADPAGTRLCAACSWAFGGRPPNTLRMWTLVARTDRPAPAPDLTEKSRPHVAAAHLHLTNRRDLRWVAATLADPPDGPWLVAVAQTGQKHTTPLATVNHGGGVWTVRMDAVDVTCDPGTWRLLLSRSAVLRAAGHSAVAVESGHPHLSTLDGQRLAVWREHAPTLAPYRGAPALALANYVITKETCGHYVTTYPLR